MVDKVRRNKFNRLLHISLQLKTQSPAILQRALHQFTQLLGLEIYSFNLFKDKYFSLELSEDIKKLKLFSEKFPEEELLQKYKLTKQQNCEMEYFLSMFKNRSTRSSKGGSGGNYTLFTSQDTSTRNTGITVFTIGYEGVNVDKMIGILGINNVKILVDVRANPFSYKPFYSKFELEKILPKFGIKYLHFPSLGIDSSIRNNESVSVNELWNGYKQKIEGSKEVEELAKLVKHGSVCLMCFEKNICDCHRNILADRVCQLCELKRIDL